MTSGTSLVGIATFEQTTHAACVAKLLGRSPETATPEDLCRIKVHPRDSVIVVSTYGRGMWAMDALKVRADSVKSDVRSLK